MSKKRQLKALSKQGQTCLSAKMQYRGKFQKERECHGHYDLRTAEEEEETKALEYNAVMEQQ